MKRWSLAPTLFVLLIFLLASGCSRTVDPDDDWGDPLGTAPFVGLEERGLAPLEALEIEPPANWVGPVRPIRIIFNEDVDRSSVETHLFIGDDRRSRVEGKYFFSDILDSPRVMLELTPLSNLEPGKQYYLYLDAGIRSALGVPLVAPRKQRFIFSETNLPRP